MSSRPSSTGAAAKPVDVFLNPGEYFVGDARHRVRTLLGSCVSITLWHAARRVGAMSHFLLWDRADARAEPAAAPTDGRYGRTSLEVMLRLLAKQNIAVADCEAKLFGGGNMFPDHARDGVAHIGRRNGEEARHWLRAHGLRIVSESLFGNGHRKIRFDIATGDVWARQVEPGIDTDFAADPGTSSAAPRTRV